MIPMNPTPSIALENRMLGRFSGPILANHSPRLVFYSGEMKRRAHIVFVAALFVTASTVSRASGEGMSPSTQSEAERQLPMSQDSTMIDLFNRWEQVWNEGKFDLVPSCVAEAYIRHDPKGDRTVTPMPQKSSASIRIDQTYASLFTITRSQAIALGFVLHSSGRMPRPARHKPKPGCRCTGSWTANSRKPGSASCRRAASGRTFLRCVGRALPPSNNRGFFRRVAAIQEISPEKRATGLGQTGCEGTRVER